MGNLAATDLLSLAPHGSVLIDPQLPGSPTGPPSGFQGSAVVSGNWPLVATAYELDPQMGSDAYNGEGQGYLNAVYLPSVRNYGPDGTPMLFVQNPCCAAAQDTITYYNSAGAQVASQTVSLPMYGSAAVDPRSVLGGGFEGAAIITSDRYPAAVARSVTTSGAVSTTTLYAGTQNPDQRLHFPIVHRPNADGSGQETTFSVQNVSPASPITVWVTFNDEGGATTYFNHAVTMPPWASGWPRPPNYRACPPGFNGTAEVLWPWLNGWNQGFPLLATAGTSMARTAGSGVPGSRLAFPVLGGYAIPPDQLLEGISASTGRARLPGATTTWAPANGMTSGTLRPNWMLRIPPTCISVNRCIRPYQPRAMAALRRPWLPRTPPPTGTAQQQQRWPGSPARLSRPALPAA